MAKIMGPHAGSETRGRVGGLIHNTWRGISYVKAASSPAQPRSKVQLQIRAWNTMLTRWWGETLDEIQRGYWRDYANTHSELDWTGNPKRLTGLNWFTRCNVRLLQNNYPITEEPPSVAAPDALEVFAAADGILQSVITWTATAGTDKIAEVWYIGPHSAGVLAKIERASRKGAETGESGTITMTGLRPGRYTFFARAISEENGLASPWVSDTASITAA